MPSANKGTGDDIHTVSLYADDLLPYIHDVSGVLGAVAQVLDKFATLLGLKINWTKTCLFRFTPTLQDPAFTLSGDRVTWQPHMFRCLDFQINRLPTDLFESYPRSNIA